MIRILGLVVLLFGLGVNAKPYRAMVTRTTETTGAGHAELGVRYQGFFVGAGRSGLDSLPFQQVALSGRYAISDSLELDTQVELQYNGAFGSGAQARLGDIPIGLQWRFLRSEAVSLGVFGRATIPGLGVVSDIVPPTLSDGTFDLEGTLLAEVRLSPRVRIMGNLGYLHHGVRSRTGFDFDVPDAIRFDVAITANVTEKVLLGLELVGRTFLHRRITPYWDNNQQLIELIPGARIETIPGLVFELALGIPVTQDLQQIYRVRPLLGLTYEFSI